MGTAYVARSANLSNWAADVGLGKTVFKLGYVDGPAEAILKGLKDEACCGETDWIVVRTEPAEGVDEATLLERLRKKEKMVEPGFYPKLRGALGVFKVKLANVENHLIVKKALAGMELDAKALKPKPADIAAYLLQNALGRETLWGPQGQG